MALRGSYEMNFTITGRGFRGVPADSDDVRPMRWQRSMQLGSRTARPGSQRPALSPLSSCQHRRHRYFRGDRETLDSSFDYTVPVRLVRQLVTDLRVECL